MIVVPLTWRRNRTPAQGSAAWPGSYWTAVSPICLKRSIHFTILLNKSTKITVSPFSLRYRHRFLVHSCLELSASCNKSVNLLSLSGRLKLMFFLLSSLICAAAVAHRSLLQQKAQSQHELVAKRRWNALRGWSRGWCRCHGAEFWNSMGWVDLV